MQVEVLLFCKYAHFYNVGSSDIEKSHRD